MDGQNVVSSADKGERARICNRIGTVGEWIAIRRGGQRIVVEVTGSECILLSWSRVDLVPLAKTAGSEPVAYYSRIWIDRFESCFRQV